MPSKIDYVDEGWPVVTGCTHCAAGCQHCYAARLASTRLKHHPHYKGLAVNGRWTGEVRCNEEVLEKPLHWRKPRRVLVPLSGDLFHETVPFEFVDKVFAVMQNAKQHTFLVLTKRAERMAEYLEELCRKSKTWTVRFDLPLCNVWLGVSISNQDDADRLIPPLLECPAAKRFVSFEPALEDVDFTE